MGATPVLNYALILPRDSRLVYELPLVKIKDGEDGGVVAVFQSKSADGGASWSEPKITRQAEIYVLDVPPFSQPFQGRGACQNFCVERGHEIIPKGLFHDRSNDHQEA